MRYFSCVLSGSFVGASFVGLFAFKDPTLVQADAIFFAGSLITMICLIHGVSARGVH